MPRALDVTAGHWDEIRGDLLSTPELERAAVGFAGLVGNGSASRMLLRDWWPVPSHEYMVQLGYHLEVSPVFWARAAKRARQTGEALVVMHSHPGDPAPPRFSPSDDAGDDRLVPSIQARASVPVAGVVVSHGGESARVMEPHGQRHTIPVHVLGDHWGSAVDRLQSQFYDRQVRALGRDGQSAVRALRVGVVGAGGLGSHVIQQLLHLGVGEIKVVDRDAVSESNLSRLVGAHRRDARLQRQKTKVSSRLARRVGSDTRVVEISQSVTNAAGATALLDSDVIFCCTDNHWSRMVLNTMAFQYYVPVLDLGVELQARGAAGGRITWLAPGSACLWCMAVLDPERVRIEQLPQATYLDEVQRGYVEALDEPAPAVVSINGVVASIAVTELLARVTRFAGDAPRASLLLYRLADGVVRRTAPVARDGCPTCSNRGLLGSGDLAAPPWR
jgi:molybdopterin/thiamine biosynthesis adenylyltransferase